MLLPSFKFSITIFSFEMAPIFKNRFTRLISVVNVLTFCNYDHIWHGHQFGVVKVTTLLLINQRLSK